MVVEAAPLTVGVAPLAVVGLAPLAVVEEAPLTAVVDFAEEAPFDRLLVAAALVVLAPLTVGVAPLGATFFSPFFVFLLALILIEKPDAAVVSWIQVT